LKAQESSSGSEIKPEIKSDNATLLSETFTQENLSQLKEKKKAEKKKLKEKNVKS
jgi:hypothetical protein